MRRFAHFFKLGAIFLFVLLFCFVNLLPYMPEILKHTELAEKLNVPEAQATTAGQMKLYFHKEPSDKNETYNSLSFTPPEPAADTAAATPATNTFNPAAPALCEASTNTGETFNRVSAINNSAAHEGCIASFISPPVGQAITISVGDTAPTAVLWIVDSANTVTGSEKIYLYKWDGTTLTNFVTLTSTTDPSTTITSATWTSSAFTGTTFAATDQVVAIATKVFTSTGNGNSSILFDSTARANAQITLKYTPITPNKPSLAGAKDDDFTSGAATTACNTTGVAFNTKWTCLNGTATNSTGSFNDGNIGGTTGDTSEWLWLNNQSTSATFTPSNFGTTPSNTWMYQALDSGYGDGVVRTVINSTLAYTIGATNPTTPFSHAGLVLWTSDTDYIEVQVYSDAAKGAINTAKVALNNCTSSCTGNNGTITSVSLNASVSSGFYNRVWVGFQKTGTNYQAQYSTNGTIWNNIGSAVTHTAFTRVGLNSYDKVGSLAASYASAFEWFQHTFLPPIDATSYTNGTESALDFAPSSCADGICGGRIGQTITITGTSFGSACSAGTTVVKIGIYEIPCGNVSSWTSSSITFTIPAAISVYGGTGTNGLIVRASGIDDSTPLEFWIFPDITSTSPTPSTGAREGDTVTMNGNKFGASQGTGSVKFQNCAGADVTATVGTWSDTSISMTVPSGILDTDDSCDILVTRDSGTGSKTDTSNNAANNLGTFVILPNITSLTPCTNCVTNAARECVSTDTNCNDTDTDGLVLLNGNHFGMSQGANGKVEFTGGFGTINAPIHATAEGACTIGDWAAGATSICVEVSPSISNSVYTGTITMTRNDLKTNVWIDFRVLPRIISNTPTNGIVGNTIQILGNHLCQSGICPVSPNRSNATDNVAFGSTQATNGDFQNVTGGAGACNGASAAWVHTEICVKVPTGTPVGSQPTKVRSGAGTCPGPTCYESNTNDASSAFTINSTTPNDPTSLQQYKINGSTVISVGGGTNETSVVFKALMSGLNPSTLCLQIENGAVGPPTFTGTVTAEEGGGVQEACKLYTGTPVTGVVTIPGLLDGVSYHWRARVKRSTGETSVIWVSFGGNAENPPTNPAGIDFLIDTTGPGISGVCAVSPSASSCDLSPPSDIQAQIRWTTSESADEQVAYGTTCPTGQASAAATFSALTNKQPSSPTGSGASHSQIVSGLTGGTTYQYMVRSSDSVGNISYDPPTANTCNTFPTSAVVTRIMKTNTFYIQTSKDAVLSNAYPKTFTIFIPESNTLKTNITFKSIMIEISGITVGTGGAGITISPNLNSGGATAHTLLDPGSNVAVPWAISYPVSPINFFFDCPGCSPLAPNTLDMAITGGGASTIVSAKAVITYFYTP